MNTSRPTYSASWRTVITSNSAGRCWTKFENAPSTPGTARTVSTMRAQLSPRCRKMASSAMIPPKMIVEMTAIGT